jgi:hypothetical protein
MYYSDDSLYPENMNADHHRGACGPTWLPATLPISRHLTSRSRRRWIATTQALLSCTSTRNPATRHLSADIEHYNCC